MLLVGMDKLAGRRTSKLPIVPPRKQQLRGRRPDQSAKHIALRIEGISLRSEEGIGSAALGYSYGPLQ